MKKINSDDEPVKAIRKKKKASMVLGAQAVGKAGFYVISAGIQVFLAAEVFLLMDVCRELKDESYINDASFTGQPLICLI